MTPHKQLIKHDPENGKWGDCYRTCIACLLDLEPEQVPHFMEGGARESVAQAASKTWLAERGMRIFAVAFPGTSLEDLMTTMGHTNPGAHYMLSGLSALGSNHVVIAEGGEIAHDPSGNGIVGPMDDGYFWVEVIAVERREALR